MRLEDLFDSPYLFESKGVTLNGLHFSHSDNLRFLDSAKHGTGIRGAERKRQADYPHLYNDNRVYFYIEDEFKRREPGLGIYAYRATLKNLYDMDRDPDGLKRKALEAAKETNGGFPGEASLTATLFENLVLEKGYNGYFSRGVIIVFHDVRDIERAPDYEQ